MQGIILDELEKYVGRELGEAGLSRMRGLTGRSEGGYRFDGSYPDEEVHLIVRGVVEATGKAPDVVMEEFAEAMVPGLLSVYGFLVNTEGVVPSGSTPHRRSRRPSRPSAPDPGVSRRVGPA